MNTLTVLLLALLIERFSWDSSAYRQHHWFLHYQTWLSNHRWSAWLVDKPWSAFWLLLPLLALLLILQIYLLPHMGWFFSSIFALLILLFSLGPNELGQDAANYLKTKATGDSDKTQAAAQQFSPTQEQLSSDEQVSRGILYGLCQRLLGPVVWFILLGPIGAASYRLLALLATQQQSLDTNLARSSQQFFYWIDWIPARITSMGFAIVGNFDAVLSAWKQHPQTTDNDGAQSEENKRLVYATGQAALTHHTDDGNALVEASLSLVWYNLTLWVALVSVLTLFSLL